MEQHDIDFRECIDRCHSRTNPPPFDQDEEAMVSILSFRLRGAHMKTGNRGARHLLPAPLPSSEEVRNIYRLSTEFNDRIINRTRNWRGREALNRRDLWMADPDYRGGTVPPPLPVLQPRRAEGRPTRPAQPSTSPPGEWGRPQATPSGDSSPDSNTGHSGQGRGQGDSWLGQQGWGDWAEWRDWEQQQQPHS